MTTFPRTGSRAANGYGRLEKETAYPEAPPVVPRLRMLLEESAAVVEELSLPSLYRRVVRAAVQLVPLTGAALAVLTPEGAVVRLVQREDDAHLVGSVPLNSTMSDTLTTLLSPLSTRTVSPLSTRTVSRLAAEQSGELPQPWSAGFTAIPAHYRRTVLAVLLVREPAGGLSTEDEDLLLSLAVTAGTAIENARLYEEARRH